MGRVGLIIALHTMYGVYHFQIVSDSDFVSAQYLENELIKCIRMENGIQYMVGHSTIRMW